MSICVIFCNFPITLVATIVAIPAFVTLLQLYQFNNVKFAKKDPYKTAVPATQSKTSKKSRNIEKTPQTLSHFSDLPIDCAKPSQFLITSINKWEILIFFACSGNVFV